MSYFKSWLYLKIAYRLIGSARKPFHPNGLTDTDLKEAQQLISYVIKVARG